ncbi:hypothetical protein ACT89R_01615 [Rhodococcus qingshengii]
MANDPIETINVDLEIIGIPQAAGMPPMTDTYLHVRRRQDGSAGKAVLGLPAYEGAEGPRGAPGAIHQGDRTTLQLQSLTTTLGALNTNWAYRNVDTNDQWIWVGDEFVVYADAFGAEGPPGPPPSLNPGIVKYDGVREGRASMEITGPEGGPYAVHLDLPKPPQGEQGPRGFAGPIYTSVDVSGAPTNGQVLRHNATTNKLEWWTPRSAVEEYVVPPSGFPTGDKASTVTRFQLCSVTIPAKSFAYRLDFSGGVDVNAKLGHLIDVEIRLGDAASGTLVGYGKGQEGEGWREVAFRAHSNVAIEPGSTEGVIPADTEIVLYVTAVKKAGILFGWGVRNNLAQLRIRLTGVA